MALSDDDLRKVAIALFRVYCGQEGYSVNELYLAAHPEMWDEPVEILRQLVQSSDTGRTTG